MTKYGVVTLRRILNDRAGVCFSLAGALPWIWNQRHGGRLFWRNVYPFAFPRYQDVTARFGESLRY